MLNYLRGHLSVAIASGKILYEVQVPCVEAGDVSVSTYSLNKMCLLVTQIDVY